MNVAGLQTARGGHALSVELQAIVQQQAVSHAPAPAVVRRTKRCAMQRIGDLRETRAQLKLSDLEGLGQMALSAAVLTHNTPDLEIGCPVMLLQDCEGSAGALPGSQFSLGKVTLLRKSLRLEHRLLKFRFSKKPFELA